MKESSQGESNFSFTFFINYITESENTLKYDVMNIKQWKIWYYWFLVTGNRAYVVAQFKLLLTASTKFVVLKHKQNNYCFLVEVINMEATCQLGNSAGGEDVWAKGLSVL